MCTLCLMSICLHYKNGNSTVSAGHFIPLLSLSLDTFLVNLNNIFLTATKVSYFLSYLSISIQNILLLFAQSFKYTQCAPLTLLILRLSNSVSSISSCQCGSLDYDHFVIPF